MKCEVIKDLAPLYKDKLTCDVTNTEIENHLSKCTNCNSYYKAVTDDNVFVERVNIADINGVKILKKVRKKHFLAIIISIVLTAILIFSVVYISTLGTLVNSNDVDIVYHITDDDYIYVEFILTNGEVLAMTSSNWDSYMTARQSNKKKFDDGGIYPKRFTYGFHLNKNEDGVYIINSDYVRDVKFADKTITIDCKEIADELGIDYVV